MKYYAGIGSREHAKNRESVPKKFMYLMQEIGFKLAEQGWILNSGGADGSDIAFQSGCEKYCDLKHMAYAQKQQIFLPYDGFNSLKVRKDNGCIVLPTSEVGIQYIKELHPAPASVLSKDQFTRLMCRNVHQVLGYDLKTPVKMVICYANNSIFDENGNISDVEGGTGQAVRIAYKHHIPVFNLTHPPHLDRIKCWLK